MNTTMKGNCLFSAAAIFGILPALAAPDCVKASSFGWNAEDSTVALQAAFDSGARKVVIDRQAGDWITRPLFITNSNIEVVLADGVALRAKRGEFHGKGDCLIKINGKVENVVLRGDGKAVLAMNKTDYQDPKNYAFSEWRHAVSILSARNVTVRDLTIISSGGDGVYLRGPKNVTLEDLVLRDHHRQGMSPISVEDMTVRRCSFKDTNGTAPQCGMDMEPNHERGRFVNVVYEDCEFSGNRSHGIALYFAHFSAHTQPVSITFRRCKSYGNGNAGLSFTAGVPYRMEERGQVKGTVRFEDCTFVNNGAESLKIFSHSTNGMEVSFAGCVFDARGSRAESAMFFSNIRYLGDFGGLAFDRCTVKLDEGKDVCIFEAQRGIGIGGRFSGVLAVERGGVHETFDLAAFAAKHVPRPEIVSWFRATKVDFRRIKTSSENITATGKFTPFIRRRFVYVVSVPETGEYRVRFNSKLPRQSCTDGIGAIVQLLDKMGTDLGKFDVPVGDFEYKFNARKGSVYRFEVASRNGAVIRVACDGAAGALLADMPIQLHDERNVSFSFSVPAEAEVVTVRVEPGLVEQVELVDSSGMKMAKIPYQKSSKKPTIFNVKRSKTAVDEVWNLKFGKIMNTRLQIGVDSVPLLSVDPGCVLIKETKWKFAGTQYPVRNRYRFVDPEVPVKVFYDAAAPIENGSQCRSAVILIHGWGGNVRKLLPVFNAALAARAGAVEPVPYVIAPMFPRRATLEKNPDESDDGRAVWNDSWAKKASNVPGQAADDWRGGGDANGTDFSSYDYIDRILCRLGDKTLFPKLKRVVLAGFSAGGQFAGRYAAIGKGVVREGIDIVYIAMSPSTEFRFEKDDLWLYGLKGRPRYGASLTDEDIMKNLCSRRVWRGCGSKDVLGRPHTALDMTPPAVRQGKNRLERFRNFEKYLDAYPEWKRQTTFHVFEGIGHQEVLAYPTKEVLDFVFGVE